ncbi:uncharacterized protein PRCAT00004782001 [Priceomyces carsonii]|uniref:uncharacterized protein n=1 Tax=Priceomyces carsonii TaxID=28549 RepID=UPI002ED8E5BD|nr:unnamed protein product [Priceomyces carsonii]
MGKNKRVIGGPSFVSDSAADDDSSTSSNNAIGDGTNKVGALIDHRMYDDFAHIHSSPARARRRNSLQAATVTNKNLNKFGNSNLNSRRYTVAPNTSNAAQPNLPLTNRNLQSLLTQSNGSRPESPGGGLALDMDSYAKDQRKLADSQSWKNPFSENQNNAVGENDDGDSYSINSLEFGGSNPSSEHPSDSTSLDDVCFPDYYDHADTAGSKEIGFEWPDLRVLEEFVKEELEEHSEHITFGDYVKGHSDNNYNNNREAEPSPSSPKLHSSGEISEDTPLLNNTQINEVESLELMNNSLKIRPTPIQPWEKSKEKITPILNRQQLEQDNRHLHQKGGKADGKVCRFTYFREDLDKTIHSPTISGLIANNNTKVKEQSINISKKWRGDANDDDESDESDAEITSLEDLFLPAHYSRNRNLSESVSINESSLGNNLTPGLTEISPANPNTQAPSKSGNPMSRSADHSAPGTVLGSTADPNESSVNPFWLDVLDPTEEEMKVLSKTFGIHPLTTEDIFLGEAREKVELFRSYYFICFTSFDIVYERRLQRAKEQEKTMAKLQEMYDKNDGKNIFRSTEHKSKIWSLIRKIFGKNDSHYNTTRSHSAINNTKDTTSIKSRGRKIRDGELLPLNMYIIIFKHGVITFHFAATPHPINVRRRARLLRDYLTVSSDWLCYALIDDITDSFAPMIESIEEEVNSIEDAILKMHSGDTDLDTDSDVDLEIEDEYKESNKSHLKKSREPSIFYKRSRSKSIVDSRPLPKRNRPPSIISRSASSRRSTDSKSSGSKILGWKRKGDMLRRIGECRKRVMSVLRLLGSKADVIKGFSKRFRENVDSGSSKIEIGMYLGDIQDHIVTMVQSLNHYEKLLARFHSNYLAQINIDMTKVNNDTNDVLGKITILGTIVLPINVVTGLWGMNCLVPGQDYDGLAWFWSIIFGMALFSIFAYHYAKRVSGL